MSYLLANHAWYELVGPFTLMISMLLCYWYVKTMIHSPHYNPTTNQKIYFFTAISLFFLVKGTPFAVVADYYLVSALILQLSIIIFIAVPLFILSLPKQYVQVFFWRHKKAAIAKVLFAHPWPLALLFNALITIFTLPPAFNAITGSVLLQFFYEVLLVMFALLTWWMIIQPSEEIADHSYFLRGAYVFIMVLFLMPVAIFLIVAQQPMYTPYMTVSGELIPALNALNDQQLAGGFLKLMQLTSYSIAIYYLLKLWGTKEEENEGKVDGNTRVVQGVVIQLDKHNHRDKGKKR
ncbi:cytochrome c oxidase assembly protein [Aquibacillus sediminis]|uniref:cytochrome c oxidase assembly protein n=1 Tax=Aquibacillus sediminis TaxID=2574734 RepID=UPI0011091752|nr:cytochrome c oxidase assembly protein [Aquibacillus sediminis]